MACYQQTQAKSSKNKNGGCGKLVPTGSGNKSLSGIMSEWKKQNRPGFHEYLDGYRSPTFPDILKAASHGEWPPNSEKAGKRHPHQWRISDKAMKQWAAKLGKAQAKIRSFQGRAFEELFDFFDEQARTVSGIGPLMVYDTALRIGANIGCFPKDWVYLHAHARIPGVRSDVPRIRKTELPEPFNELEMWEAYEIEDFLCVCQKQIKELKSRS
ncbi:MAG: hypothetical protein IJL17_09400 [Kiritimatiellae bacterium]|nr:hypothetical protein [Kiritimatiellia bacterium]